MKKFMLIAALICGLSTSAFAATAAKAKPVKKPAASSAQLEEVQKTWAEKWPRFQIDTISNGPVAGVYEVKTSDANKIYVDATGQFLMVGGQVIQMGGGALVPQGQPQAQQAQQAPQRPKPIDAARLNTANYFESVRGAGSVPLYVFTDPDCPFCKRYESSLAQIENLTVRYVMMPVTSLHPNAMNVSKQIACAPDVASAWKEYMASGALPATKASPECLAEAESKIQANLQLAAMLQINGTPTTVHSKTGEIIPGAYPAEAVQQLIKAGKL